MSRGEKMRGRGRVVVVACLCFFGAVASAIALDGSHAVAVTVPTGLNLGWKTFEILSGNDSLGSLAKEGFLWTSSHDDWDGVGAYLLDSDTLRVFVNHEAGAGSTFSRVDLDLSNLQAWVVSGIANNTNSNQVAPPGPIVTAVSRGWTSVGSGTGPIFDPCSSNVWEADTFGPGRGFADRLYLTGEESPGGHFWIMDTETRTLYEAPDPGAGAWESATPVDTGRTDTIALLMSEDLGTSAAGTAPLRLYVGTKNPGGSFLERNGFVGGKVYYWDPEGVSTNGTMSGIFSGGNGAVVSGSWAESSAGAARFSKTEDVHTNMRPSSPGYGVEVAIAAELEGVFLLDLSQVDFVAGDLGVNRNSEVLVLFKANTEAVSNQFDQMDNLVWSADGRLYLNEDDLEGDLWFIDVASLRASYAEGDFTPSAAQVFDILDADFVEETSGITDISDHLGYQPGSVFLTACQSSTLSKNQLAMMVSPAAALKSHYLLWVSGFPALSPPEQLMNADPDGDGLSNAQEYAFLLDPSVADASQIVAGVSVAGLPLVETRTVGTGDRLVVEYVRRLGVTDLTYTPQFGADLSGAGWGGGGTESVFPIDATRERVVVEDSMAVVGAGKRFGRLKVELAPAP